MITNSNIDFLTLKNTSVAGIIPPRLLTWLYVTVLAQPFFQSLIFWLVSKDILTTMTGFMLGVAMIIIWMSYDSGFFRALNQCIWKCKVYKGCHHKIHNIYNHLDSALHLFWVFIAPPLSVVVISVYAIASLFLHYYLTVNTVLN